jgi:hypothetical protein
MFFLGNPHVMVSLLEYIVAAVGTKVIVGSKITLDHTLATVTLDTIVAFIIPVK